MHTKRCLAQALISAVENARDREDLTSDEFLSLAALGTELDASGQPAPYTSSLLGWAVGYLSDGLQDCRCYSERGAAAKMSREEFYAEVQKMQDKGWTAESAWNHLEGSCDIYFCGACQA